MYTLSIDSIDDMVSALKAYRKGAIEGMEESNIKEVKHRGEGSVNAVNFALELIDAYQRTQSAPVESAGGWNENSRFYGIE